MSLQNHRPIAPLSPYVETIWLMTNAAEPSARVPVYPHGSVELVIHLASPRLSFFEDGIQHHVRVPLLAGPYSKAFSVDPATLTAVLGVRFKPGASRVFFSQPVHELHNTDVPLQEIYPREAEELYERLMSTPRATVITVLQDYLLHRLQRSIQLHPAVAFAVRAFQQYGSSVAEVRAHTGLSHTRFIQLFRDNVGIPPKMFCRIQRFRSVLARIDQGLPVNWAAIAADCGYFDQAHLIRDFRTFSGVTPAQSLQLAAS